MHRYIQDSFFVVDKHMIQLKRNKRISLLFLLPFCRENLHFKHTASSETRAPVDNDFVFVSPVKMWNRNEGKLYESSGERREWNINRHVHEISRFHCRGYLLTFE